MSTPPTTEENPHTDIQDTIDTSLHPWWGLLAIFAIGFPLFFLFQPTLPEKYDQISGIDLIDQNSNPIDDSFFATTPSVVNFIFTRCKDICPALSQKMQYIQSQVPNARLISITVDPEYDTPTVLSEYQKKYQAGANWFFLTGTREQITKANSVFQQAYKENSTEGDAPNILHSQKFILIDQDGFVRGFYDDNSNDLNVLIKDYHRLKRIF